MAKSCGPSCSPWTMPMRTVVVCRASGAASATAGAAAAGAAVGVPPGAAPSATSMDNSSGKPSRLSIDVLLSPGLRVRRVTRVGAALLVRLPVADAHGHHRPIEGLVDEPLRPGLAQRTQERDPLAHLDAA